MEPEPEPETPIIKKKKFIKKPTSVVSVVEKDTDTSSDINDYIAQLTPMEKKVLHIAQSHLESSFHLIKSIGFQEWKSKQKTT